MKNSLVPFRSKEGKELFKGAFLVPADWKSRGVVIHISGGKFLQSNQLVALAITKTLLTLCDNEGPITSIPIHNLQSVRVVDLTGITIPVNTPSGIIDMVPKNPKGVSLNYFYNPGIILELVFFTFSSKAAYKWTNTFQKAILQDADHFENIGEPEDR